jgi:hypothetical protein
LKWTSVVSGSSSSSRALIAAGEREWMSVMSFLSAPGSSG